MPTAHSSSDFFSQRLRASAAPLCGYACGALFAVAWWLFIDGAVQAANGYRSFTFTDWMTGILSTIALLLINTVDLAAFGDGHTGFSFSAFGSDEGGDAAAMRARLAAFVGLSLALGALGGSVVSYLRHYTGDGAVVFVPDPAPQPQPVVPQPPSAAVAEMYSSLLMPKRKGVDRTALFSSVAAPADAGAAGDDNPPPPKGTNHTVDAWPGVAVMLQNGLITVSSLGLWVTRNYVGIDASGYGLTI